MSWPIGWWWCRRGRGGWVGCGCGESGGEFRCLVQRRRWLMLLPFGRSLLSRGVLRSSLPLCSLPGFVGWPWDSGHGASRGRRLSEAKRSLRLGRVQTSLCVLDQSLENVFVFVESGVYFDIIVTFLCLYSRPPWKRGKAGESSSDSAVEKSDYIKLEVLLRQ